MEFARLPDFPRYRIYKNGDVIREYKNGKERLLKHRLGNHGYYLVSLYNGCKQKVFLIHRLIALLFIPNHDLNNTTVDHVNRIRTDNRIENLRWLGRDGQNLNKELKDTNTGYAFIYKRKSKSNTSGFDFCCRIRRNNKYIVCTCRAKLEDSIEIVRTFLLENEYVFDGIPEETKQKIKEKYNIQDGRGPICSKK